jgi:hypothetical protein
MKIDLTITQYLNFIWLEGFIGGVGVTLSAYLVYRMRQMMKPKDRTDGR